MKYKQLNQELVSLKMLYEDALLRKASPDELKKILQKIDEMNKLIAGVSGDRLH